MIGDVNEKAESRLHGARERERSNNSYFSTWTPRRAWRAGRHTTTRMRRTWSSGPGPRRTPRARKTGTRTGGPWKNCPLICRSPREAIPWGRPAQIPVQCPCPRNSIEGTFATDTNFPLADLPAGQEEGMPHMTDELGLENPELLQRGRGGDDSVVIDGGQLAERAEGGDGQPEGAPRVGIDLELGEELAF